MNLHTGKHSMKVWVFQYSCLEVCWNKLCFLCKPETSQLVNPLLPLSDACDGKAKDFSAGFHKIGAFRKKKGFYMTKYSHLSVVADRFLSNRHLNNAILLL